MKYPLFLTFFLFVASHLSAQEPKSIHFKKDRCLIIFFQTGIKSDTITANKTDRFILLVPDTLKENLRINIDNATFDKNVTDTLVRLVHLPGMRYEAVYTRAPSAVGTPLEKAVLTVQVNGVSQLDVHVTRVQFVDKRTNKVILENQFYFKN